MSEYCVNCEKSGERIAELTRQLEETEGELWLFGNHLPDCHEREMVINAVCNCGWSEIVERLEQRNQRAGLEAHMR